MPQEVAVARLPVCIAEMLAAGRAVTAQSRHCCNGGDAFSVARAGSPSLPGGHTFLLFRPRTRGRLLQRSRSTYARKLIASALSHARNADGEWHGIYLRESLTASSPA